MQKHETSRRRYKRYQPTQSIKGIVFPIADQNVTTQMLDVEVINYSDGGVLVQIHKGKFRPTLQQEVYFLLTLEKESIFTLKGTIVRIDGKKQFAIQFNESIDHIGAFPQEDIEEMKARLLRSLEAIHE